MNNHVARALAVALIATLLATACGSDSNDAATPASEPGAPTTTSAPSQPDDTSDTSAPTSTAPPSEDRGNESFPISLDQQLGVLELDTRPDRIVTLDAWSLDLLTELEIEPVMAYTFGPTPAWLVPAVDGIEIETVQGELPLEQIAGAKADLIMDVSGFFTAFDQAAADQIVSVGTVLSPPSDGFSDRWQARFQHIGEAVGRTNDVTQIIAETEAKLADAIAQHPQLNGAAITFARYNESTDTFDLIVDESDFTRDFLNNELGFATPAAQQQAFDAGQGEIVGGALTISAEQMGLIGEGADAVVLFVAGNPAALDNNALWQSLEVVQQDKVLNLDLGGVFSIRTPSPRSIDHVIDAVLPPLASAVDGSGASATAGDAANVLEAANANGASLIGTLAAFSPNFLSALTGPGPTTALLPTDTALEGAPEATAAALRSDLALLEDVLLYHVIDGSLSVDDIVTQGQLTTLLGEAISVRVEGDTVILNDGQAMIDVADLAAPNGIAHLIDGLLIPPSRAEDLQS